MSKPSDKAVLEFTEMMEMLLGSGLSIRDALEVFTMIDKKTRDDPQRGSPEKISAAGSLGEKILSCIHKGASFAQAVDSLGETFPSIYRGLIQVGNAVGSVERIFPQLGVYLRDKKILRDKVSSALVYPILVLIVAFLGTLGLVFFVMPKMELIFSGFGGDAGEGIQRNIRLIKQGLLIILTLFVFILCSLGIIRKTGEINQELNSFIDRCLLDLPLIGKFITSWETFNLAFAMEVLTGGGISVEDAIREAAVMISNSSYRQSLFLVREKVLNGGSLAQAFLDEKIFPPYLGRWISVGERAGKTEGVFAQIRSYYQDEIEQRTAKFLLIIEPAMIAVIGVVILGLVAGIIVPLFSIYGTIL
jgi:type II secretory pathway component PulF